MQLKTFLLVTSLLSVYALGETGDEVEDCSLDADISCVDSDGEDCVGLMIRQGDCSMEDIMFEFNFCNTHPSRILETMKGVIEIDGSNGLTEAFTEEYMEPLSCITVQRKVSTSNCVNSIGASIDLHGWFKDVSNAWATCDRDNVYRVIRKNLPAVE